MGATHFSGPVSAGNLTGDLNGASGATGAATASTSVVVGGGATIKGIFSGTKSITVAGDAAAAEEDISVTITGVAAGDIVRFMPNDSAMETGVGVVACWVSATNTVKLRISNFHTSTLSGSTSNWTYIWFDLT